MEIISATNTQMRNFAMDQQQHEAQMGQFQAIFQQMMDAQPATGTGAANAPPAVDRAAIRDAAEMFESYFLQIMFREMRRTTFNEQGFLPKSHAEKIFTEMMDEEVSKSAAAAGGIGIADMIYRQMTRHLDPPRAPLNMFGGMEAAAVRRPVPTDE